MTILLPTEKSAPSLSASTAKVLLYGYPKVGKTTLAGGIDPDHTLFLATEAGQGALEAYIQPVRTWDGFRDVYAALSTAEHGFTTVVIDTVDLLYDMATDAAMAELGVLHPADLQWGKGWKAVSDKFKLGVGGLANLGLGIWFVSHAKDVEIQQRVGTITKAVPTIPNAGRDFLTKFCDHIFFQTTADSADGEVRVLKTDASEYWEAGSRTDSVRALGQIVLPEGDPAAPVREALAA